ncbi:MULTISPECIES: hypothetical protein [Sorangium]|uniref:Uncharacterized protein n=1 Tax=Sorangium cellulosum TaxID=56 RepID=A0A4P2QXG4_SORCE|nr:MULTISPECIES: hypothetical protein [Sorangium]AUX35237.1 uncharacterized protein SOCE836_074270 [Sorangium cellulosum]WCQ94542.1 hypothetical protein NQZ70_07310 [Sorangium sp. Soce836]
MTRPPTRLSNFLQHRGACPEAVFWSRQGSSLEELWLRCPRPEWMLWAMAQLGYQGSRRLHRFAARCARRNLVLLADPRSAQAIDVAERHANAQVGIEELRRAFRAAQDAAEQAAARPGWTAALACAMTATARAARNDALDAAREASSYAARAVAWDIHRDATLESEEAWQADELRQIVGNDIDRLIQVAAYESYGHAP